MNNIYHTWSVALITRTVAAAKMPKFTNAELADNALLVYWFYDENSLAALRECQHSYPDLRQPCQCVFENCIIILEKQAFSCCMHVLVMEDAVCGTRRMHWTSCTLSMYSLYKGCSQETDISVSYSHDGCCTM